VGGGVRDGVPDPDLGERDKLDHDLLDRNRNGWHADPQHYYVQFWHQNAINAKAYGFPYDDDAGQSSDISVTNPQYMVVAVGW
jgi:Beta-1,3-glucanase